MKNAHFATLFAFLLFSIACMGTSQPRPGHANGPGCPETFVKATMALSCAPLGSPCRYHEGSCQCRERPQCGGVGHPPETQFSCTSTEVKRLDGCAYEPPHAGEACALQGEQCSYGPCGHNALVATCANGKWTLAAHDDPAPP